MARGGDPFQLVLYFCEHYQSHRSETVTTASIEGRRFPELYEGISDVLCIFGSRGQNG